MPDKSFAEKILRKAGPGEIQNPEDDARAKERQLNAFGLGVRFKDGRSGEGFSWADYRGYRWEDEGEKERVTVIFGARVMTIEGYNLDVLVRDLEHGQLARIREHNGRQVMQLRNDNPENEPIIESIQTAPRFEEIVKEIKGKTNMTPDSLEKLADDDLRAIITRAETLLRQHDTERKEKAMDQARATLAAVGLTLKDLKGKKPAKGPVYHGGHVYQHPANKALIYNGKGKKPGWLTALEAEGKMPIEAANDNVPATMKKTG